MSYACTTCHGSAKYRCRPPCATCEGEPHDCDDCVAVPGVQLCEHHGTGGCGQPATQQIDGGAHVCDEHEEAERNRRAMEAEKEMLELAQEPENAGRGWHREYLRRIA